MSGFSFSHQFSQRWLDTPPAVKTTIIQELDDIVSLLHPDVELDDFQFSVTDIEETIEQLMVIEQIRQAQEREEQAQRELEAARAEQERIRKLQQERDAQEHQKLAKAREEKAQLEQAAQEQALLEQQHDAERLEQDRIEIQRLHEERLIAKRRAQQPSPFQPVLTKDNSATTEQVQTDNQTTPVDTSTENNSANQDTTATIVETLVATPKTPDTPPVVTSSEADNPTQPVMTLAQSDSALVTAAEPTTVANENQLAVAQQLEDIKQHITAQLQQQITTYLQDAMQDIKDDLQHWLATEIDNQLKHQLAAMTAEQALSPNSIIDNSNTGDSITSDPSD